MSESKTPRTDDNTYGGKGIIGAGYVSADFARSLELELAEAKQFALEKSGHENILKERDSLHAELLKWKQSAGFCEQHQPNGGVRNCLVCGCIELTAALDKISYACGTPNEMRVSDYCLSCNQDAVVKQVEAKLAELLKSQAEAKENHRMWEHWQTKATIAGGDLSRATQSEETWRNAYQEAIRQRDKSQAECAGMKEALELNRDGMLKMANHDSLTLEECAIIDCKTSAALYSPASGDELLREVEELRIDKQRLDWLQAGYRIAKFVDGWNVWPQGQTSIGWKSDDIRTAIDQAIAAKEGK